MAFTIDDVYPRDVKKGFTDNAGYIARVNDYYSSLLLQFGVSDYDKPSTISAQIMEHLRTYANMIYYRDNIGGELQIFANGGTGDPYAEKFKLMKGEFDQQLSQMTYETLTNCYIAKGIGSGQILRG